MMVSLSYFLETTETRERNDCFRDPGKFVSKVVSWKDEELVA